MQLAVTAALLAGAAAHGSALLTPSNSADASLVEQELQMRQHASVFDARITPLIDAAADFDLYVLAQSWQPEFCYGKEQVFPGCRAPQPFWRDHFTLHGLWPEREHGAPPGFCGGEPFDAAQIKDAIGLDVLTQFWPDVKFSDAHSPEYADFWKHEWTRHGTCSRLTQVAYFTEAVLLVRNGTALTPALVTQHVGQDVPLSDLRDAWNVAPPTTDGANATAVLQCARGGSTLAQVYTCWSKDAAHRPIARRACPDHVLKEDTCKHATIHIPAFA